MEQEFAVPFPAENWGFDRVGVGEAQSKQSLANLVYRCRLNCRIAHDAALSYLFAPCFELRFYQHYDLPVFRATEDPGKAEATTAGRTRVAEMNETSMTTRSTGSPTCSGVR